MKNGLQQDVRDVFFAPMKDALEAAKNTRLREWADA